MKPTLTLSALIALGAALAPLPSMAQTDIQLYIGSAPPAPIYEYVPAARPGYVWAPGYWEWRGRRHAWVPGYWIAARPGYVYAPPRWHQRQGGWYMEPGRWDRDRNGIPDRYEQRGYAPVYAGGGYGYRDGYYRDGRRDDRGRGGYRDTDRDGIPNRYDRDLDNDGIRNDRDRDRDGDRVPNRYDSRPDNPYRR
ncbi:YXWGXW repeat-containing protein [Massilia oculi]|uniref:YXWGXW repeat-containing protein n=1 Tax=Massilia hydrophila TaxID=3044279 RepID=A0ABS7Y9C5_9BURK|nr:YXWGXW repeat-containing protein [Massilia oculi]MCA1856289.1 YXWGXW repeat-containing protein [Massilia oculi]